MAQRYGQLTQSETPLPGARLTAADTPTSEGEGVALAEGGAGQRVGSAEAALGGTAADIGTKLYSNIQAANARAAKDAKDQADQLAVMAAKNALDSWHANRLYTPGSGALEQHGPDAFGLPEQISQEFGDVTDKIEAGLTDTQKGMFAQHKADTALAMHTTILRHVAGEMTASANGELNGRIANSQNLSIANAHDPLAIQGILGDVVADVKASAPRLGLGPEQVAEKVRQVQSATHVAVINRLLADKSTTNGKLDAQLYFDEAKPQISGDDQTSLEKALAVGTTRNEAQTLADKIGRELPDGTPAQKIARVKELASGETRDEAIRYIKEDATVDEQQKRADLEALRSKAFATVDRTHSVRDIPAGDLAKLGEHVEALRHYAEYLNKGEAVPTDWAVYTAQMLKASSDPAAFAKDDPMAIRDKLGDAEFKQIVDIRSAIIKTGNADKELTDYRTHNDLIDNSLTQYGFDVKAADKDPTKPAGQAKAELHRMVNQAVAIQEAKTGKKATTEDVQSAIDRILSTSKDSPGSWWGMLPFTSGHGFDRSTPVLNLTIADVSPATRAVITRQLRQAGAAVSDVTILDAYRTLLVQKRQP